MIGRDSWILILVILGSIAGYFATLPDPRTWDWPQYCNVVVFITGLIAARLSKSDLAASTTPKADRTTMLAGLLNVYKKEEE
jgi:hypothetical protein